MKDYQAYIFDFDGTLFDTEKSLLWVYEQGFEAIHQTVTAQEVGEYMHFSLTETAERRHLSPLDTQTLIQVITRALDEKPSIDEVEAYSDTFSTLQALQKAGKKILIVSGNCTSHILKVLDRFDARQYFHDVIGNDGRYKPKPAGDMIVYACSLIPTIPLKDIVYVGDSLQDPLTAHNGEVDGILLERHQEYPHYTAMKIATLEALLEK
jgi:HAD superfamily hydrolase (TIGR01549 family)